jgi:hypothetical protein
MDCRAAEAVLSGPAGTGKSRACLEKVHALATVVPGLRALIVRKTRESLTQSALVTWEENVVEEGHPMLAAGGSRGVRQAYHYPNGSEVALGGMDKASKVLSTEYDLVYAQQAEELAEHDWEALTTRLRHGALCYQQLMGDCNPDAPTHWLKRRADSGRLRLLESRHEDNPALWDHARGSPTPQGADYLAKLDALTGARYWRLRRGLWVQAEGVVWEDWDPALHLIDRFAVPQSWPRYWSVDFGYTNPFVLQWWAADPDGRLYRYREIYRTRGLVEDHARRARELSRQEPRPRAVICDHDAEDRATLERHLGMATVPARKDVSPGIQAVAARLRKAGDGRPRLFLMRDSLDSRDPELDAAKKPCRTEEELDGYVWDLSANRKKGEEPLKQNDHGADAMRYVVSHLDLVPRQVGPGAAGGTRPVYGAGGVPLAGKTKGHPWDPFGGGR